MNPRRNNEEFTKYSFPSKDIEYLSSGAPVAAYKLDGIPDEYDEYMIYVDGDGTEALRHQLQRVCAMSDEERRQAGMKGRRFVTERKNPAAQAGRILELFR